MGGHKSPQQAAKQSSV